MSRAFTARYPGICADCEEQISPGDELVPVGPGEFEHVDCVEARAHRQERGTLCELCGLFRPCDCDDWSPAWTL